MKKHVFAIAAVGALLAGCNRTPHYTDTIAEVTRALASGDAASVKDKFSGGAQADLTPQYVAQFQKVIGPLGEIQSVNEESNIPDGHHAYTVKFQKGERVEDVWFDGDGKIREWHVHPAQKP